MLLAADCCCFYSAFEKHSWRWSAMDRQARTFHLYYPPCDKIAPFAGLITGTIRLFVFYQATISNVFSVCSPALNLGRHYGLFSRLQLICSGRWYLLPWPDRLSLIQIMKLAQPLEIQIPLFRLR
jgi:hypothetical protein